MSANILLRQEQKELLKALVEADNKQHPSRRQPFFAAKALAQTYYEISHYGLPNGKMMAYQGDYQALIKENLIWVEGSTFEVSPLGFEYYKKLPS